VISRTALDAVTNPSNMSAIADAHVGVQAVEDGDVVAELRRLEGLGADEARQLGREAVIHVGGHIERRSRGLAAGRLLRRHPEVWWVPRSAVRS
jgi:hypothetical protein